MSPARDERENERAAKLRLILERPKDDREAGVPQGTLKNNHRFSREELKSLCATYLQLFEKAEKGRAGSLPFS